MSRESLPTKWKGSSPRFPQFLFYSIVVILLIAGTVLLTHVWPILLPFLFAGWILAFWLDLKSTREMYSAKPKEFHKIESNPFFVVLIEKFSFKSTAVLFILLVEVPIFLFAGLAVIPTLSTFLYSSTLYYPSLGGAACALAYTHARAWRINRASIGAQKGR